MAKVKIFFDDLKEEKQDEIKQLVKNELFADFELEAENEDEIDEYRDSPELEQDAVNEINCNNIGTELVI